MKLRQEIGLHPTNILLRIWICLILSFLPFCNLYSTEIYLEEHCNNLLNWTNKSSGSAFVKVQPAGFYHLYDNDIGAWRQADILYDKGTIKNYFKVNCRLKFNKLCTSTQIDTMDGSPIDGTGTWDTKTIVPKVGAEFAFSTTSQRLVILFLKDEIWFVRTGFVFDRVWVGNLDTISFHDWEFKITKTLTSSKISVVLDGVTIITDQLIGYPETSKAGWVEIIAKGDSDEPVDWHLDYIKLEHSDSPITEVSLEQREPVRNIFLSQNYPNPFNSTTIVQYSVESSQSVTLKIFDILGREITTLVDEVKEAGAYNFEFSNIHFALSTGVYIYRLRVEGITRFRKMTFLK